MYELIDLSDTLINVIDIWDTDPKYITFANKSKETIEMITKDTCEFSKFLSIKLEGYKKQGAHVNIAMHRQKPNPFFTFLTDNRNNLTFIEDSTLLKKYMEDKQLTQLIICGAHLFKCISDRPTGYIKMKTLVPNTKIAVTLSRALPEDAFVDMPYPTTDLVYL